MHFFWHHFLICRLLRTLPTNLLQVILSLCGLCSLLKIFHCSCFVQETSVTSSWWSVLMLMSQQLAALILLALPACRYRLPSLPPSFKAAATAARHAHFNTPDSFDRLYGLIILNIYRSHFPKPSMFIQHLRDHSTAPSSPTPHNIHTSLFSPSSCFSPPPPLAQPPGFLYYNPSSRCIAAWIKWGGIFVQSLLSGHPFL